MKKKYWKLIILVAFFLIINTPLAQGQGRPPDTPGRRPPGPPGLPIDAGIIALLSAGAFYGVKKIKDSKK